ncbi:MAG: DMT family transporter [Rhizobiales bacterium]|nr:DMT family transporter [Hyphomicrobiales bacterium]
MGDDVSTRRSATFGILVMALGTLMLPGVDAIAKHLSATHSPAFLSWARYAAASCVVVPFAVARFGTAIFPREQLGAHFLRTAFIVGAMSLYFFAVVHAPLANAITAFFVAPVVAMVLAVMLLGERLTGRKLASLTLGVAGTLIIVRPSGAGLNPGLLLALGAGILYALYSIATRMASQRSDPVKTLVFQCVVGSLLLTPQAISTWSMPRPDEIWLFALLGLISVFGHLFLIIAYRHAQASLLAPIVYLELVGSALLGYLVFGDVPGASIWIGAAAIIAAGIVLLTARPR